MINFKGFKSDINQLVQDHYKLHFLLKQFKEGNLQAYTDAEGGGCRNVSYDEIVEIIEARCN